MRSETVLLLEKRIGINVCSETVPLLQERINIDRHSPAIVHLLQEGVGIHHHALVVEQERIGVCRHAPSVLEEWIGIYLHAPLLDNLRMTVKTVAPRRVRRRNHLAVRKLETVAGGDIRDRCHSTYPGTFTQLRMTVKTLAERSVGCGNHLSIRKPEGIADLTPLTGPGDKLSATNCRSHVAEVDDTTDQIGGTIDRDSKADAVKYAGRGKDGGVDPDNFATDIEHWPTAAAPVYGGVGLDKVFIDGVADLQGTVTAADHAGGDRLFETERAANGQHHITGSGSIGITKCGVRKRTGSLNAQQGHVGAQITLGHFEGILFCSAGPVQSRFQSFRTGNDMITAQNITPGIDNDTRADFSEGDVVGQRIYHPLIGGSRYVFHGGVNADDCRSDRVDNAVIGGLDITDSPRRLCDRHDAGDPGYRERHG